MNSGILYLDKPEGYTSRDVDSIIKRKFGEKKVGHLGTLDPFATGLLILGLGEATKVLSLIEDEEKEYAASLFLGEATDTEDKTGVITEVKEVPELSSEQIQSVLNSFLGKSFQKPNPYSARHINGVRAYQLARSGIDVTLPQKEIEVIRIRLLSYQDHIITFSVTVSKGTYIRALGRDIALKLETVGHLSALRRVRVGSISVNQATTLDEASSSSLLSIQQALPKIRIHLVRDEKEKKLAFHGQRLSLPYEDRFILVQDEVMILGIYQKNNEGYDCYRGIRYPI